MQKFKGKLKNVPRNAPQVPCSTNPRLKKEEILSAQDKVLTLNNLDVDQHQHKGGPETNVKEFMATDKRSVSTRSAFARFDVEFPIRD